jgi:hypothetical protein
VATVIGESGAWQIIVADIARRGYSISKPRELPPLLAKLEEARPQMIDTHRTQTMRSVQERETRIAALAAEQGFFRRIFNWFGIRALKAEIATLYKADSHYSFALDQTIARVRSLLNSAELAGAEAELAVIDRLRMLPSPTVVFNDVQLHATRHIHFDGAALMSAQIDHVVLTPAGVFVVETKRWSHRFMESGDFYNPFDQVSRASYLCYDLLRESFGKTRVRSIIACVGSLPDAPRDSYIKVVRPESMNSYISGFRNIELASERFNELRNFFEYRVNSRTEI